MAEPDPNEDRAAEETAPLDHPAPDPTSERPAYNRRLADRLMADMGARDLAEARAEPERVGPYRVLRRLGGGAMGVVLEAEAPSGGLVAIKLLRAGADATPSQRRRFDREARALAEVDHPGVVRLRDVGEHEGAHFIVLDHHAGGSLHDLLRREQLAPEAVAELGAELADALAACHARGVLHRDLKPDNVLINAEGAPLLTDFGISKHLERADVTERLTKTGTLIGTMGFMAPEQAGAKLDEIGPAADVYGLGATLYTMLAGRPPFVGSFVEVAMATANAAPQPLHELRPETPPRLEAVVLRCLEKDPAARWASAADLAAALRDTLQSSTTGREGARLFAALGLAAAAVLGLLALTVATRPPSPAPPPAVTQPRRASPTAAPPTPSAPKTDERAWGRAADLLKTDPARAWSLVAGLERTADPAVAQRVLRRAGREAQRVNGQVKASSRPIRAIIDETQGLSWLACLRFLRKLEPGPLSATCVDGVPRALLALSQRSKSLFPVSRQEEFVTGALEVLQGQYVPGLTQALTGFVRSRKNPAKRRTWLQRLFAAAEAVPLGGRDWIDVQRGLLGLLTNMCRLRPLPRDGSAQEALAVAELIAARCERLHEQTQRLETTQLDRALRRAQSKVYFQLGRFDQAARAAKLGAKDDPLCRAVLALSHARLGVTTNTALLVSAIEEAHRFFKELTSQRTGQPPHLALLDTLYGMRARPGAAEALRDGLKRLTKAKPREFHLWGLRYVLLLLEAGQKPEAAEALATLTRNTASKPGCCRDGSHAAAQQVARGPLTSPRVRAALVYARGLAKLREGDHDGAITDCTKAIDLDPRSSGAYCTRGAVKIVKRDYDGAIADCTKAIDLDPRNDRAYAYRGLAKVRKRDFKGAIADCTKAIDLDPTNDQAHAARRFAKRLRSSAAYADRALRKYYEGDYDGAIADCGKAIELDPANDDAYVNRGLARTRKRDFKEAIVDCAKAIDLDPRNDRAYCARGYVKKEMGDYAGAIVDCTQAIEINSTNYRAYFKRGHAKLEKRDYDGASADCTKAIELYSGFAAAHFVRGLARQMAGHPEAAVDLRRALELDPSLQKWIDRRNRGEGAPLPPRDSKPSSETPAAPSTPDTPR